jgi:outer membrane protein OmpA-like peptidoglycan-associated protein
MIARLKMRPISALLCASLCLGTAALAQDATNAPKKVATSSSGEDQYPDLVEIDPFGGISIYGQVNQGLTTHLVDGGVGGLRIAVNPTKYVGLELWADYAQANVEFKTSAGPYPAGIAGAVAGSPIPPYSFGSRNFLFGLNPVFNLRPRGSKVIPYLTVGVMGVQYTPTNKAEALAKQPISMQIYGAQNLNDNLQVGLNYGGGVKMHLSDHFGLRVDVRGLWTRNPTYGLQSFPSGTNVYIPAKNKLEGMQATLGLVIFLGQSKCPPMPPAPPPPAPLPTPTLSGAEGGGTLCPGKPVTVHASINAPSGHTLTYAWTVNGQPQSATGPDLTYTPTASGTVNVQVTVTDTTPPPPPMEKPAKFPVRCWIQPPAPQPVAPVTATTSFTVASDAAPTISSVSAATPTLACAANTGAHTTALSSSAQGSACGGNLTYKWTVSEGTLTNDSSPNPTFDASSINFEGGAQGQSKTVTATVTVTDQAGKTATQNTTITVSCQPTFVRLDDVIFAKNNSRVNNCGKRVLIDDAAARLASGDYDLVLVGHRDTDEAANAPRARGARRGTPARPLDQERVMNAAAVLSGGTGTCGHVDPSRIKVDYVGTDQTSETRPGQCGTSNTKERKGSETSDADKNRRVEVYLVPHGATTSLPPAVKNLQQLPEADVKALGCPK